PAEEVRRDDPADPGARPAALVLPTQERAAGLVEQLQRLAVPPEIAQRVALGHEPERAVVGPLRELGAAQQRLGQPERPAGVDGQVAQRLALQEGQQLVAVVPADHLLEDRPAPTLVVELEQPTNHILRPHGTILARTGDGAREPAGGGASRRRGEPGGPAPAT